MSRLGVHRASQGTLVKLDVLQKEEDSPELGRIGHHFLVNKQDFHKIKSAALRGRRVPNGCRQPSRFGYNTLFVIDREIACE